MRTLFLLIILVAALSGRAEAQPEIVPAEHPVYDFLHQQRVRGLLPEYRHEWRPLDRRRVGTLLDSLEIRGVGRQGGATAMWFGRFAREIREPAGSIETVVGRDGSIRVPLRRESEKFLYYHRDEDWRLALNAIGTLQLRVADEAESLRGAAFVPEGIFQGNYRGLIGFYSGTFNGLTLGGDTRVLRADPILAPLYYIGFGDVPQGNFDRSTASVRVSGPMFSAEIGHARLMAGASFSNPLVLAENSDYFSYLRAGVEGRVVQYAFMHGALGDRSTQILGDDGAGVLVGPQRYIAMHRLSLSPLQWLQLGFTETVIYGGRGPELAYLNPVYPIKPAEHALWDRDNANFALEAIARPLPGLEAYATWFVADLDLRRIGQGSYNNKWAVQAGLGGSIGSALGWVEYTRIEPFVYTHRFLVDGSFYNSYVHNDYGLGHPLGPNTDQWAAGLRGWLLFGLRGEVIGRYVRRGENFIDPETGELVNVGGDVRDGRQPPFADLTKQFLGGDRFEGPGLSANLTWEPIRGIGLRGHVDYQSWDRDPNRFFLRTELFVRF
ncbi:hypothetical protein BH23BAC4_BH23BAC4_05720 [soil metagenome]